MDVVTFTDAQDDLAAVIDRVVDRRIPTAIARDRSEAVVMVPISEWQAREETDYLLSTPANREALLTSIAELNAGRGRERDLLTP